MCPVPRWPHCWCHMSAARASHGSNMILSTVRVGGNVPARIRGLQLGEGRAVSGSALAPSVPLL